MKLHKDFIELLGYGQHWNGITYIPTQIDADDETCTVEMTLVNEASESTPMVFQGKHDNFNYVIEVNDLNININLKTGVLRKLRVHRDDE